MTPARWVTWAAALAGVSCAPTATSQAPGSDPRPQTLKAEPTRETTGPFRLYGPYGVSQGLFSAQNIPCGVGMCGSWWNDSRLYEPAPGAKTERARAVRRCERLVAPGLLLTANGRALEALVAQGKELFWRETHAVPTQAERVTTQSLSVGGILDIHEAASQGPGRFVLTRRDGSISFFPEGTRIRPPRAQQNLFAYSIGAVWASGDEILFVESGGRTDPKWVVHRPAKRTFDTIAQGHIGRCGRPLFDGKVVVLHGRSEVLVFSTSEASGPRRISGNPLDESSCVSGEGDLIAVTGRSLGLPAVAIHNVQGWQVVRFDQQPSYAQALVKGDRIVVSLPEERVPSPQTGVPIPASGAAYLLSQSGGQWTIQEHIVPASPSDHGLFGFAVDFNDEGLFINQMVPGAIYDTDGGMETIGEPIICHVPWIQE